ncbi:MAG: DUF2924 domain-containing protein [Methylocystis sp.]|uniref:DUF2924 domain-containing protein n=1 Tax=Methylocystis sp. TaxID=1911079 RepID=UPI003DA336E3
MSKASINIAAELNRLELRDEWRRLHRAQPPMRLSRDLLMRGITYKLQERPLGGLSTATLRKLASLNAKTDADKPPASLVSLKPGTRLVCEWRGATHSVLVHSDGFEWNGERYSSLTLIAAEPVGAPDLRRRGKSLVADPCREERQALSLLRFRRAHRRRLLVAQQSSPSAGQDWLRFNGVKSSTRWSHE